MEIQLSFVVLWLLVIHSTSACDYFCCLPKFNGAFRTNLSECCSGSDCIDFLRLDSAKRVDLLRSDADAGKLLCNFECCNGKVFKSLLQDETCCSYLHCDMYSKMDQPERNLVREMSTNQFKDGNNAIAEIPEHSSAQAEFHSKRVKRDWWEQKQKRNAESLKFIGIFCGCFIAAAVLFALIKVYVCDPACQAERSNEVPGQGEQHIVVTGSMTVHASNNVTIVQNTASSAPNDETIRLENYDDEPPPYKHFTSSSPFIHKKNG